MEQENKLDTLWNLSLIVMYNQTIKNIKEFRNTVCSSLMMNDGEMNIFLRSEAKKIGIHGRDILYILRRFKDKTHNWKQLGSVLYHCRNSIVHNNPISYNILLEMIDGFIHGYNKQEDIHNNLLAQIIQLCEIAIGCSNSESIDTKGVLRDLKTMWKLRLKGKKVIILSGKYNQREAIFIKWNGTNSKLRIIDEDRIIYLSLDETVEIIHP